MGQTRTEYKCELAPVFSVGISAFELTLLSSGPRETARQPRHTYDAGLLPLFDYYGVPRFFAREGEAPRKNFRIGQNRSN